MEGKSNGKILCVTHYMLGLTQHRSPALMTSESALLPASGIEEGQGEGGDSPLAMLPYER